MNLVPSTVSFTNACGFKVAGLNAAVLRTNDFCNQLLDCPIFFAKKMLAAKVSLNNCALTNR